MGTVFNRNSSAASETPHLPSPGRAGRAAGRAVGEAAGQAANAAAGLAVDGPAGEVVGAAGSGAVVGAGASTRGPPATWGKGHQNLILLSNVATGSGRGQSTKGHPGYL